MSNKESFDKNNKSTPSISKYFSSSSDAGTIFDEISSSSASFQTCDSASQTNIFGQNVSPISKENILQELNETNILSSDMNADIGNEADRRRDAWPFNNSKHDLQLTLPGVTIQDDLVSFPKTCLYFFN